MVRLSKTYIILKLGIGEVGFLVGNGAIPDESFGLSTTLVHMSVHSVVAETQTASRKPFGKGWSTIRSKKN